MWRRGDEGSQLNRKNETFRKKIMNIGVMIYNYGANIRKRERGGDRE